MPAFSCCLGRRRGGLVQCPEELPQVFAVFRRHVIEVAVTAVKTAMAAANQAYDSFTKVAKQASEIAEANFSAASTVAKDSLKKKAA
mgnify:CR=1 FL=1